MGACNSRVADPPPRPKDDPHSLSVRSLLPSTVETSDAAHKVDSRRGIRAAGNAARRASASKRAQDVEAGERASQLVEGYHAWMELAWLAIFITLLRLPVEFALGLFSQEWRKTFVSSRVHLRLCLEGLDPWHAMVVHALPVSSLTERVYLKRALVPSRANPPPHTHERVKIEYLSKIFGEHFEVGEGDYDGFVGPTAHKIVDGYFDWLMNRYPLLTAVGPRFTRDEYYGVVRDTFQRFGVYNGHAPPPGFDLHGEAAAIQWVTLGYGAGALRRDEASGRFVADYASSEERPVRPGFRRVGGQLWLSPDLSRVVELRSFGRSYVPADAEFKGALYLLRTAMIIDQVAGPHTMWSHYLDAACVTTAIREIDYDHPLRRFVAPFTVGTLSVTYGAKLTVIDDRAMLARVSGFTAEGMAMMYTEAVREWRMETFRDACKRKGVAHFSAEQYPFAHWGQRLSACFEAFAADYVAQHWVSDAEVAADAELQLFFGKYSAMFPRICEHPPPPSVARRAELVTFMAHFMWAVTAQHEHTGNTADSLYAFEAGSVSAPAESVLDDVASLQPTKMNRLSVLYIQSLTTKQAPTLYRADESEVSRFFLPQRDQHVVKRFMDNLFALHLEINAFRTRAGIPIRPMAPPIVDPVDIKIGVSV